MLRRYRDAVRLIDENRALRCAVLRYFHLGFWMKVESVPTWSILENRRLMQADLVLCLLRLDTKPSLRVVAELMGKPITYCPTLLARPVQYTTRDVRRVRRVVRNPRLPTTGAFQRFKEFRVGRTVEEMMYRGVTRRDIRLAMKRKWVEIR